MFELLTINYDKLSRTNKSDPLSILMYKEVYSKLNKLKQKVNCTTCFNITQICVTKQTYKKIMSIMFKWCDKNNIARSSVGMHELNIAPAVFERKTSKIKHDTVYFLENK